MTREQQTAWAAGVFEGEGCFYFNRKTSQLGVMVGSTDRDVLETFCAAVGVGAIYARTRRSARHKQQFYWQTNSLAEAVTVGELLGPYLHGRRRARYAECVALRQAFERAATRRVKRIYGEPAAEPLRGGARL